MAFEFPMRGEKHRLTPSVRTALSEDFIDLPDGVTHFEYKGRDDGPVVVLVHGFSVPYFIWDPTFEALTMAGYRVLRYDLFGRGYSDRPFISNHLPLFDRQLVDLLDSLSVEQVHAILGLSMGGLIAANFAAQHPARVQRLGLIDPAGFPRAYPFYIRLLKVPGLGECLFSLVGQNVFRKLAGNDFYDPAHIDVFIDRFLIQMQFKGFRRSLLSTVRSGILESGEEVYPKLGGMDIPVLLVWGEQDYTTPFNQSEKLINAVPEADFYPIANSGHIPHYQHASQVNPILLEFLNR